MICEKNIENYEIVYKQCSKIIKEHVKKRLMGCLYRVLLAKSIEDKLFFYETDGIKIIGFCLCRLLKKTKTISIDKIAVDESYRNRGVGKKLLNKVKSLNIPLRLDVVMKNDIAVAFYIKNGFIISGTKILGKDIGVLIMKFDGKHEK